MTLLRRGLALLSTVLIACAARGAEPAIPEGEQLLNLATRSTPQLSGPARDQGSVSRVAVTGQAFDHAWRVAVRERQSTSHHVQLAVPVAGEIARDDVLFLEFHARLVSTEHETGMIDASNVIELNGPPHSKALNPYPWSADTEWKLIQIPLVSTAAIAERRAVINFRLGGAVQTVDIGGISLRRMPAGSKVADLPRTQPELYAGHEPDAPWRAVAAERIREHRMADLAIRARDADGKPLPDVSIHVDQTSHAFRFGTAVNNWRLFPENPTPAHARYAEIAAKHFNQGTLESAHKWTVWERRRQQAIDTVEWLREHDMTVRGHVLLWPSWRRMPKHLAELKDRPDELRARIAAHFEDLLGTTRGIVTDWDVVNEPQTHFDILDLLGHNYVIEAFQMARRLDPDARLFLNEALNFNSVDKLRIFERQAVDWRSRGAPIDGLGIQAHYSGWSLTPPEKIWAELDRLAAHGFALQVTEFDIDTDDSDLQARYLRDFYTALFAHPAVDTIQMWGFWEGSHWKPKAALWRKNWTIKPVGQAYVDLLENEWRTRTTLITAADGNATVRGFLGDYTLTLTRGDETRTVTVNLARDSAPVEVTW
ncbi:MAG: endo-1,4-beta-xylanase [Verrucomicrobiota bacterium]